MPMIPGGRRCVRGDCVNQALPGSSLCASHCPEVAVLVPRQNRNVKPDFHASVTLAGEPQVLPSLDSEIALLAQRRDALDAWVQEQVEAGRQIDLMKYVLVLTHIGHRIARMLKDRAAIGGATDAVAELFDHALDRLNEEVEAEL